MSLRTIYERFLGSPNPSSLSDDVSLNYITSLKTFAKPEAVVRHLEKQNKNEVRKKGEKVLGVVEGQYSLSLDLEMSLEFVSSGGAYLPGLENFVADRVVTFPCIHIVNFNDDQKIQRIRIYWDQASLLKQVEVIGARGRNWPVADGIDQSRLIASVLSGSKVEVPATRGEESSKNNTESARSISPSKKRIQDPHASLDLFNELEETESRTSQPAIIPPRLSAKPAQRDYSELFAAGHEDLEPEKDGSTSPGKAFARPMIAPKGAGSAKFQPSRLFDEEAVEERPAAYKSNPAKYNHFDLAEGLQDDSFQQKQPNSSKNVPLRARTNKHASQWDFEDFVTPEKVRHRARGQDVRHFDLNEVDGNNAAPSGKVADGRHARPDTKPQFEFQDDGSPDANRLSRANKQRGAAHNSGLGLYQNNLYSEEEGEEGSRAARSAREKEPLSAVTANVGRAKDMNQHWTLSDTSPASKNNVNNENRPLADDKQKAIKMMDANWASYDHSPKQPNENNRNGQPGKPLRKGMESHWGFEE